MVQRPCAKYEYWFARGKCTFVQCQCVQECPATPRVLFISAPVDESVRGTLFFFRKGFVFSLFSLIYVLFLENCNDPLYLIIIKARYYLLSSLFREDRFSFTHILFTYTCYGKIVLLNTVSLFFYLLLMCLLLFYVRQSLMHIQGCKLSVYLKFLSKFSNFEIIE
jgi:hypothetical protein